MARIGRIQQIIIADFGAIEHSKPRRWVKCGIVLVHRAFVPQPRDEIYRDAEIGRRYHVVYFTELDEHTKDKEINDAMRGEHVFDGYLRNYTKQEGKRTVSAILERLNSGEKLSAADIERDLKPFMA